MPRGIASTAWSAEKVTAAVRELMAYELGDDPAGLNVDDALWCYAYEPNCQKVRTAVYQAAEVTTKAGLIDWCETHSVAEQIALLGSTTGAGEPCDQMDGRFCCDLVLGHAGPHRSDVGGEDER